MEGKKIAVTGGAGMIGSHLVELLVRQGNFVYIVDNLARGRTLNELARIWVSDLTKGSPLFEDFDIVYHLAAKVTGIEYNRHNHMDMYMQNQVINMNVADAVVQSKPKLFVNVSTACVYPHDAPVPTPEKYGEVCNPEPTNWGYGVAKWNGEQMARMAHKEAGVPSMNVRFFNALGPRDYYDEETSHVAPALIRRVLEGDNPVVVWGSGKQTRALVDCRDIALALFRLGDWGTRSNVLANYKTAPAINIGHHHEVSIHDLAFKIIELAGKEVGKEEGQVRLVFDRKKPDGYARRAADTTKLWKLLEWIPDTPLETTLADMIADYRERFQ
jgi:nucleoside-diphosphate-sugar epimerase